MHARQIEELLLWHHLLSSDVTILLRRITPPTYATKYDVRSIVRTIVLLATVSHDVPSNLSEIRRLSEILQINLNADGGNITTVSFKTTKI